jgi:hypothetical protein
MYRVTKVEPLTNFRLYVEFADGVKGEVALARRLFGPMFEPLKDPELFGRVQIDEFGAVCWPNGADLAPDALHRKLVAKQERARPRLSRSKTRKGG